MMRLTFLFLIVLLGGCMLIYNKNVYNTDERGYKFRGW